MQSLLLTFHILFSLSMIMIIFVQKNEGKTTGTQFIYDGNRSINIHNDKNLLTYATIIIAGLFMTTSICLAVLSNKNKSFTIVNEKNVSNIPVDTNNKNRT